MENEYSMPEDLISDIHEMQANDSINLINSYLDISDNILGFDDTLYDNGDFDEPNHRKDNTRFLLEQDYAIELEKIRQDMSDDDVNNSSNINAPKKNFVSNSRFNSRKNSSYFNSIRMGHKSLSSSQYSNMDSKNAHCDESIGVIKEINQSESFHYKPDVYKSQANLKLQSISKPKHKAQKQPNQDKHNDRSLSLPKFDAFSPLPRIKQTANFDRKNKNEDRNVINDQPDEESKNIDKSINLKHPQESLNFEEEKIELDVVGKSINNSSLADSFYLELTNRENRAYDTTARTHKKKPLKIQTQSPHLSSIEEQHPHYTPTQYRTQRALKEQVVAIEALKRKKNKR